MGQRVGWVGSEEFGPPDGQYAELGSIEYIVTLA